MGHLERIRAIAAGDAVRRLDRRLLCLSSLDATGGVETLLTAFGLLAGDRRRLRLDIVGAGPLDGPLHARTAELGLDNRVRFHGPLPWRRVRAAMQHCAALVLPHEDGEVGEPEEFHRPLQSAVAWGRPLVTTDRVTPPEVLDGVTNARVVPPGNPIVLALALADVLDPVPGDALPSQAWCPSTG
jgi:glycosyltransferase involved in cell wall biosynthesis